MRNFFRQFIRQISYLKLPLAFGFCLIIAISVFRAFWDKVRIKKVVIVSRTDKINGLSVFNGKNLLFIDSDKVIQHLLSKNIYFKDITLDKKYPSTVNLDIHWRSPAAEIISSDKPFFVDNQGFPAVPAEQIIEQLPQIYISRLVYSKHTPDSRIFKALTLISELEKLGLTVRKIISDENNSDLKVFIDDSIEVVIPYNLDAVYLSASLQTIISRFRIEGKFIRSIDFRFEKPLVVLKNE